VNIHQDNKSSKSKTAFFTSLKEENSLSKLANKRFMWYLFFTQPKFPAS